ncbi:hypothetical protein [Stutzerimonas azotifigens]|uniref:hypothetical protein n=1 Tax=Stutzerimonas azotifigens TaxID=291995 RepID=UPI00041489E1|nr:hypothetical protein [Stutzerimonas azotifigens]
MKPTAICLLGAALLALPVGAADLPVETRIDGLPLDVESLGVSSSKLELTGVQAVKVTNRGERTASCRFEGPAGEIAMSSSPASDIEPAEQVIMRVPDEYVGGEVRATLVCREVGTVPR